ncbi:MAG: hypothetical protein A2168_02710 [Planctomycetes bacterium RBG_13_50_24]|nr:MAG: hypothetical protein A2168_02710 [Planctomycetes bacterium RBG_13_50_24]
MPAGRKVARAFRPRIENKARMASPHTASPQTTIGMRLPPNRIYGKRRVAASSLDHGPAGFKLGDGYEYQKLVKHVRFSGWLLDHDTNAKGLE